MAESTEVTVLEGVAFDSVSAFLIAAVLGSAKGPICMVSACSDSNDDESSPVDQKAYTPLRRNLFCF